MTEFEKNGLKVTITLAIYKGFKDMDLTKEFAIEILDYAKENIDNAELKEEYHAKGLSSHCRDSKLP